MKYLLLDTCVWWNLSSDYKERVILQAINDFVIRQDISLIVPDVVKAEFEKNRNEIKHKLAKTYNLYERHARELISIFNVTDHKYTEILDGIRDQITKIPDQVEPNVSLVEALFKHPSTVNISYDEKMMRKVTEKALKKIAPFHHAKNAVADALIAEEFHLATKKLLDIGASSIFFVTDNKSDFSDTKNPLMPHSELDYIFKLDPRIEYSINIAEIINKIKSNTIPNHIVKQVLQQSGYREIFCDAGGEHEIIDHGWLPAQNGGHTWHVRCSKCGVLFDTGEPHDYYY